MNPIALPHVPVKHQDFLRYVQSDQVTPVRDLVKPYIEYDAVLRKLFAQEPSFPALKDNHLNLVPLYDSMGSNNATVRARDLASEPPELKEKYILPLDAENRRPNGSPAVVPSVAEFKSNFNLFTEGSLVDLDWSNVVVAGSAVVTCLLPVPEKFRNSKRSLRQFYHDKFAPASDVDLFLYGLTEEQALQKIKHIEESIKGSILHETTTIRTKNTITIASQYPTRHVQIVLRIYKSIAEILTGFDVDCSCAAFDGNQVYAAPRALASYITQVNEIDLSRRSPSYENRLSKYSHRGFEVFWPGLERSRIDPTVFERSFKRTVGLARLLVLEQLPKPSDRDAYVEQRRQERGRPQPRTSWRYLPLSGNLKNDWEDEAPEWLEEDAISDYTTFTIPYGPKIHAHKIEKLLYRKDLLLNAEWNRPKDREVNLHRHPAFFGSLEDVIHDCCGHCPKPVTDEEKAVSEEEGKTYISGDVTFIKDDPGRQEIGSFNPITETDWTEMAYVGNTERLCRAIVEHNLKDVRDWLQQEHSDPDTRDYTGRTPLQLACVTSTPEVVQCLVDHGARLISRVADGRTALHLAAARGSPEIVRILLAKSEQNEEDEAKKEELRKREQEQETRKERGATSGETSDYQGEEHDMVIMSDGRSTTSSRTIGSFVKVDVPEADKASDNIFEGENELEPDIYDVNVLAWDNHTSPLHLAILGGHTDVVEELVASFGADVLLPVKLLSLYNNSPGAAILTLVLTLCLPLEKAKAMTEKLLRLGASPAQADLHSRTPLHYLAATGYTDLLDIYLQHDQPAVKRVINHLAAKGYAHRPEVYSAFTVAVGAGDAIGAVKLLDLGAEPSIAFDAFIKSAQVKFESLKRNSSEENESLFGEHVRQPIITAVEKEMPLLALEILARGADPNTLTQDGCQAKTQASYRNYVVGESLLDRVRAKLAGLRNYKGEEFDDCPPTPLDADDGTYLNGLHEGTYKMWTAQRALKQARTEYRKKQEEHETKKQQAEHRRGLTEKAAAVKAHIQDFEKLECALLEKGSKTFKELFPDIKEPAQRAQRTHRNRTRESSPFEIKFSFRVPDLTPLKREGYIKLFEASWTGDLDTIKTLTLSKWGENSDQIPLQMAVKDKAGFSPFSIAILRGHLQAAKSILEIIQAQYKPRESETTETFKMDEDDLEIYSEIIDERFTIDNIGETAAQVECDITPLQVLNWDCPVYQFIDPQSIPRRNKLDETLVCREDRPRDLIQYAILKDDLELLSFLLGLGQEITSRDSSSESTIYAISERSLDLALTHGRLRCLVEIIRKTGGGLQISDLVRKSGVNIQEKPKYYQGLSIHGKKRPEWATSGGELLQQSEMNTPPLLRAALLGSLESTEWFLGTAPRRYYNDFTEVHKHDKGVKKLAEAKLGVEGSVMNWLGLRSHLVLHCAVLSQPTEESARVVQYLVDEYPAYLEAKSVTGYTPLQLAMGLHRVRFSQILVKAGANQTVRDDKGRNLMHLVLGGLRPAYDHTTSPATMKSLLDLLDRRLIASMLSERCSDEPGSLTPLSFWLSKVMSHREWYYHNTYYRYDHERTLETDNSVEISQMLLDMAEETGQKHLEVLNGAGSTPMHDAVKKQFPKMFEMMIERRPDLLHREDATGCTPFELAVNLWVNKVTSSPPPMPESSRSPWESQVSLLSRSPESFVGEKEVATRSEHQQLIYDICRARGQNGYKRKLVTLHEANEVAKRLATQSKRSYSYIVSEEKDEVTRLAHSGGLPLVEMYTYE